MTLTKEKAIELHRIMWRYIADTSMKERRCVSKAEAISWMQVHNFIERNYEPVYKCFACHYAIKTQIARGFGFCSEAARCIICPLEWNSSADRIMCQFKSYEDQCSSNNIYQSTGLFSLWYQATEKGNWQIASELANEIACLKESSKNYIDLSADEAIRRHKEMYHWLYKKCLEEKRCVLISEALDQFKYEVIPYRSSWLCEYASRQRVITKCGGTCENCLFKGPFAICTKMQTEIGNTFWNNNYIRLARLYKMMATLPERKDDISWKNGK